MGKSVTYICPAFCLLFCKVAPWKRSDLVFSGVQTNNVASHLESAEGLWGTKPELLQLTFAASMRHLPNILTLSNLFCGCVAISFILGAQNFITNFQGADLIEVPGIEQPYIGSLFIFIAAIFDLLDGAAARALKVYSPLGKDLDSLADLVSFGVAPAMILFKMLWQAVMMQQGAIDASMWATFPAFLVAIFAAVRLARFNRAPASSQPTAFFSGMPTPAVGLYVACLPLAQWFPSRLTLLLTGNVYLLYAIIGLLCYFMVSTLPFFKAMPARWSLANIYRQLILLVVIGVCIPLMGWATAHVALLAYAALSALPHPSQTAPVEK
jgi:CDP-diacylglycerol--serine O-phosphatidyltransferase